MKILILSLLLFSFSFSASYSVSGEYRYGEIFVLLQNYRKIAVSGSSDILNLKRPFLLLSPTYDGLISQLSENLKSDGYRLIVRGNSYVLAPIPAQISSIPSLAPVVAAKPFLPVVNRDSIRVSDSLRAVAVSDSVRPVLYSCTVGGVRSVRLRAGGVTVNPVAGSFSLLPNFSGVNFTLSALPFGYTSDFDTLDFYSRVTCGGIYGDSLTVRIGDEKRRASSTVTTETSVSSSFEVFYTGLNVVIYRSSVSIYYRVGDMVFTGSGRVGSPVVVSGSIEGRKRGFLHRSREKDFLTINFLCEEVVK